MLAVALGAAGCARQAEATISGGVRLIADVPAASVLVDDELLGTVGDYEGAPLPLPAGPHTIVLEHPDFEPETIEVNVIDGVATAVTVELRRRRARPPSGDDDHVLP
jgi:hypothetical protein